MKALLAAVALAALPVAAGAATVPMTEVGTGLYYGTGSATGGTDVSFDFTIPEELGAFTVELSGTGILINATLTYSLGGSTPVSITSPFALSFLVEDFGAGTYTVAYDFTGTPLIPVSVTATLYGFATAPAPVPVPAAGALAAAGVIALGALKARRKSA